MVVILLLLVVIVGVIAVVSARSKRTDATTRRTRSADDRPNETDEDSSFGPVPTFKVVALGVSGSGKTVLLASMFHQLNVQRPGDAYFLEAPADQRLELAGVFRQIANPASPWPPGTSRGDMREYTFDCAVHHDERKYRVLRIRYLDYAGEHLERIHRGTSAKLRELETNIEEASALLGIIDGYRMLQYLRNEPEGREYFHGTIEPMIGLMTSATAPLHFVLTKWDLVRGFGEPPDASDEIRLKMVIEALALTKIEALATGPQRGGRVVRIIPVSAVGPNYAHIDDSGRVIKNPHGTLQPTNLDVPFAAVVPDLFHQVKESLDQSIREEIEDRLRAGPSSAADRLAGFVKVLSIPAGFALRGALRGAVAGGYADAIADTFVDWMRRPFEKKRSIDDARRDAAEEHAATARHVRMLVLRDFEKAVFRLEAMLPSSVLSSR